MFSLDSGLRPDVGLLPEAGLFADFPESLEVGLLPQLFSILKSPLAKMLMELYYSFLECIHFCETYPQKGTQKTTHFIVV